MAGGSVTRNINAVRQSLKGMKNKVRRATIEASEDIALDLADKALNLAPVDTGELRKSADPDVEIKTNRIRAKVTFSAKSKDGYDYALIQHEDLTFNHPNGGQAKYLEKPLRENTKKYVAHLNKKVGDALK